LGSQFAAAIKNGAGIAAHSARQLVHDGVESFRDDLAIVSMDVRNMYHRFNRRSYGICFLHLRIQLNSCFFIERLYWGEM
jgi:hypothetical protein